MYLINSKTPFNIVNEMLINLFKEVIISFLIQICFLTNFLIAPNSLEARYFANCKYQYNIRQINI